MEIQPDFCCLVDANHEISCIGLLFFGFTVNLFLQLDEVHREKIQTLQKMFIEEFETTDTIQSDMLQMLLKRLVIITTRLAKEQYINKKVYEDDKLGLIRQFNVVAENDVLSDEGEAYGRKLLEAGVKATTVRYNGVIHDFGLLNGLATIPQTVDLFEQASAQLKKYLA